MNCTYLWQYLRQICKIPVTKPYWKSYKINFSISSSNRSIIRNEIMIQVQVNVCLAGHRCLLSCTDRSNTIYVQSSQQKLLEIVRYEIKLEVSS